MPEGFAVRGVIEGFYGPPYTFEQRRDLFRFLPAAGLNTYAYAPKLDPFHRDRWREPYPAEFLEHFGELVEIGREIGARFLFALSPADGFDPDAGDVALIHEKLLSLFHVGVRDFCLLFDDITAVGRGAEPDAQADVVIDTFTFLRRQDAQTTLCFISNFYSGTAQALETDSSPFQSLFPVPSSAYYRAYARIPHEIPVLWTGPAVFTDRFDVTEARRYRDYVGRPVLVWDNYPVNDTLLTEELFLAPYQGREPGLETVVDGILLNPMLQSQASKVALWTAGQRFALGEAYDPWEAWDEALQFVDAGRAVDALRTLAEQFLSHPLIGEGGESPRLAAAAEEFFDAGSVGSRDKLGRLFEAFARNEDELTEGLRNAALLTELREASHKLSVLGEAGLLALDLLDERDAGRAVDTHVLEERLAAACQNRWRVGANTAITPSLAMLLGERETKQADVFGNFFARVLQQLGTSSY